MTKMMRRTVVDVNVVSVVVVVADVVVVVVVWVGIVPS